LHSPPHLIRVVYPFAPLGTQDICDASPCDSFFRQHLNFAPCIAAFACFILSGPFPAFLRPSSPSGSLWIPPQCLFFPRVICITGFSLVASHSFRLIDPNISFRAYFTASIYQQNIFIALRNMD